MTTGMTAMELMAVLGGALCVLAAWMRAGRSARSRFWVRRWTAQEPQRRLDLEPYAVIALPGLGATLLVTALLGRWALPRMSPDHGVLVVGLVLMAGLMVTGLLLVASDAKRPVPGMPRRIPVRLLPAWLREERRAEQWWMEQRADPIWERDETEVVRHDLGRLIAEAERTEPTDLRATGEHGTTRGDGGASGR